MRSLVSGRDKCGWTNNRHSATEHSQNQRRKKIFHGGYKGYEVGVLVVLYKERIFFFGEQALGPRFRHYTAKDAMTRFTAAPEEIGSKLR